MPDPNPTAQQGKSLTGREARRSMLPAIRHNWWQGGEHFCDARSGEVLSHTTVEVFANVRSEGSCCGATLRHIKYGCGNGCPCITCATTKRRDGTPPTETRETCKCI